MKTSKFNMIFEGIMSEISNNIFETLVVKKLTDVIEDIILNEAEVKYIGNKTFEWSYENGISCQIMIADDGQVFASAARPYPGDAEAFDNDDYQVFDNHSVFIYDIDDLTDFKVLIEEMLDLSADE
jgi:hypothetical protein